MSLLMLVAKRAIQLGAVLIGIVTLLFFLLRVSGDPVLALLGPDGVTSQEAVEDIRSRYGFDKPLIVQYGIYMQNMLTFDLGDSIFQSRPALTIVVEKAPLSLILASLSMLTAIIVGLTLGISAAVAPSRILRTLLSTVSVIGQSVPVFFLGLVGILVFAATLKWLPAFGFNGPSSLIMPVFALSLLPMARVARLSRASMTEVLQQDYILTARSKGVRPWGVITKHGMRNMFIPVLTLIGYDIIQLFGTMTIGEVVFGWPGIGSQLVRSASQRDFAVVQAIALAVATAAVVITLLVEIVYRILDPRLRGAA